MTTDIALTLGVALGALVLFASNRVRLEVVGLIVLAAVILLGLLPLDRALQGFSNHATITVGLMLVLSAGLLRTGAIDALGRWMGRLAGGSEARLLLVTIAAVLPISAFINNTAAVAVLLPVVLGLARQMGSAPSRLLMPLSFAGQLGGTLTLIGTSTNLLVAGLIAELGLGTLGIFDITPPAAILAVAGVLYLLTLGRWLAPTRNAAVDLLDRYQLRDYVAGIRVPPGSALEGRTLGEVRFQHVYGLNVLEIQRDDGRVRFPGSLTGLRGGDVLLVRGSTSDLADALGHEDVEVVGAPPELTIGETPDDEDPEQPSQRLAEAVVPPRSRAVGATLGRLRLRSRFGVSVLGLQRHGSPLDRPLDQTALAAGDVLLVSGTPDRLQQLHQQESLALLGAVDLPAKRTRKMVLAIAILAAVVLIAAVDLAPIVVSALLGVIAMFLTGVLTPTEAYDEVDWMVLVLLGSILSLGFAMQETGTAEYLARGVVDLTGPLGVYGTLAATYLVASILTEVISNNAAAVVLTPVAASTAAALGISPMPLVVAVMFAASNSFMTPVGYQTNTFVYGPGGYKFSDFIRVGAPLNLLLAAIATFVIPIFFPF